MAEQFDVVIVGARCAGSPLATLLARAGLHVCVVDRARFPSDTASTHGVQPSGVKVLEQLGVREKLLEVTPAIERPTIAFDDAEVTVESLSDLVGAPMLTPRRVTLDTVLVEAAAEAGADVRTQTPATDLIEERGRVAGVRTKAGELRAPLVVGADGVNSSVARLVGARKYHETPAGRLFTWAYFENVTASDGAMWLGAIGDHGFLAFPTDAGLFMAAVVPSIERKDEVLADREAAFAAELAHWPALEATLAGARHVGPTRVITRDGFFRESAGPGWVLVGDAGHFKDPAPGQGISDALRQAVALAGAIRSALDSPGSADRALREWWAWRDRDAWEMYWFAHDMGAAGPPPLLVQEIQSRIAADPEILEGFLRVLNHEVPPSKVFTRSLALRTLAKAMIERAGQRTTLLRDALTLTLTGWRRRGPSPPSPAARASRYGEGRPGAPAPSPPPPVAR